MPPEIETVPCVYCGSMSTGTYMILGSERHACAPCFAKYEAAVAARAADMPTPEERIAAMQRGYDAAQAGKNACVLCLGVFVPPLVSDGAPVVAHKLCPRCHDAYTLGREHQNDLASAPDIFVCAYCGEPTHQQPYVHEGKAWPSCCARHACLDAWTGTPTEAPDTLPIANDGPAVAVRLSFARAKDTGETSLIAVSTFGGVAVGPAVSLPMDADFRKQLVEFLVSDEIRDALEPVVAHVPGAALAVEDGAAGNAAQAALTEVLVDLVRYVGTALVPRVKLIEPALRGQPLTRERGHLFVETLIARVTEVDADFGAKLAASRPIILERIEEILAATGWLAGSTMDN